MRCTPNSRHEKCSAASRAIAQESHNTHIRSVFFLHAPARCFALSRRHWHVKKRLILTRSCCVARFRGWSMSWASCSPSSESISSICYFVTSEQTVSSSTCCGTRKTRCSASHSSRLLHCPRPSKSSRPTASQRALDLRDSFVERYSCEASQVAAWLTARCETWRGAVTDKAAQWFDQSLTDVHVR
jgi:hypothetical protein